MRILVIRSFSDGGRAFYLKGRAQHHIYAEPGEELRIAMEFDKVEYKKLEIPYIMWLKRVEK